MTVKDNETRMSGQDPGVGPATSDLEADADDSNLMQREAIHQYAPPRTVQVRRSDGECLLLFSNEKRDFTIHYSRKNFLSAYCRRAAPWTPSKAVPGTISVQKKRAQPPYLWVKRGHDPQLSAILRDYLPKEYVNRTQKRENLMTCLKATVYCSGCRNSDLDPCNGQKRSLLIIKIPMGDLVNESSSTVRILAKFADKRPCLHLASKMFGDVRGIDRADFLDVLKVTTKPSTARKRHRSMADPERLAARNITGQPSASAARTIKSTLLLRSTGSPLALVPALDSACREVNFEETAYNVKELERGGRCRRATFEEHEEIFSFVRLFQSLPHLTLFAWRLTGLALMAELVEPDVGLCFYAMEGTVAEIRRSDTAECAIWLHCGRKAKTMPIYQGILAVPGIRQRGGGDPGSVCSIADVWTARLDAKTVSTFFQNVADDMTILFPKRKDLFRYIKTECSAAVARGLISSLNCGMTLEKYRRVVFSSAADELCIVVWCTMDMKIAISDWCQESITRKTIAKWVHRSDLCRLASRLVLDVYRRSPNISLATSHQLLYDFLMRRPALRVDKDSTLTIPSDGLEEGDGATEAWINYEGEALRTDDADSDDDDAFHRDLEDLLRTARFVRASDASRRKIDRSFFSDNCDDMEVVGETRLTYRGYDCLVFKLFRLSCSSRAVYVRISAPRLGLERTVHTWTPETRATEHDSPLLAPNPFYAPHMADYLREQWWENLCFYSHAVPRLAARRRAMASAGRMEVSIEDMKSVDEGLQEPRHIVDFIPERYQQITQQHSLVSEELGDLGLQHIADELEKPSGNFWPSAYQEDTEDWHFSEQEMEGF